jgi:colanic acid/amylovoran biosynthesis protein
VPRFLLVGHGSFANRGCEAIVRTTVSLLRERWPDCAIVLASHEAEVDRTHPAARHVDVVPHRRAARRYSAAWALSEADRRVFRGALGTARRVYSLLASQVASSDCMISIGGDNYSMDYGGPGRWLGLDALARRAGVPYVIWGASIGPFQSPKVDAAVMADLRRSLLVTVRETISHDYLADRGVVANVQHVADPAFLLEPEPTDVQAYWPDGEVVVGLNVSPLLRRYRRQSSGDRLAEITVVFLREALKDTRLGFLLVPHVTQPGNDDHIYLAHILDLLGATPRVRLAPRVLNACQLKHVISLCGALVAARTHATIAGFSSGVPTISLAYSQKAHGINRDLFGDGRWTIDTRQLQSPHEVAERLLRLLSQREEVASHLQRQAQSAKAMARLGIAHLSAALEGEPPGGQPPASEAHLPRHGA